MEGALYHHTAVLDLGGCISYGSYNSVYPVCRLLRLFRIKRRYREVFETMSLLAPRVLSACVVISVIYYFFAIIGMEIFSKYDLKNCCV